MPKMKYNINGFTGFFDSPERQWHEVIKVDNNRQVWQFATDMYQHHRNSPTFLPWNEKYLLAYAFSKKEVRHEYSEPVCIYNNDMKSLDSGALPNVASNDDNVECVKNYRRDNGGFLDKTIFSVSQGIVVQEGKPPLVFVTTGNNINVAESPVNALPSESVTRKRVKKSFH